jgi:hypothetical protein
LNAVFGKYTVAPVADTSHSLHTAKTVRGRSVRRLNFLIFFEVETLSETTTHPMPFLTMGVACE